MQAYGQEGRRSPLDQHQDVKCNMTLFIFFKCLQLSAYIYIFYIFIFTLFETQKTSMFFIFIFLTNAKWKSTLMVLIVISFYITFLCHVELLKLLMPFQTSHPSDPAPKNFHIVLQHIGTDVEKLWNHRDCSEDAQNKMVLGEVSNSLTYCALKQRKVNTTEDCTLYPLFFMTQTHLEICTEPSNTERIMLSLAAIGWATVSPVAISSGCFSISLNQKKKLGQPRVFCWCPTVYQTYLRYDGKPQRLYSGCNNLLQPCQCLRWAGLTYQWSHRSFGGAQGNDFYFPLNCANSDGFFQRGGVSILLTRHHKTPTLSHEKIAL